MKPVSAVLLVLSGIVVVYGAIDADLVTNLPGWTDAFPSRQFSGYLDIPGGKHLHYWFVESEQAPSKDPVVIWFNGGPGCSSLDGFLYEHGPMHIQEPIQNGTIPKLYINPWRWNMIANVLFIEAPACVGLSYADTNAGCRNNDTQQAIDNLRALQRWYAGFPEYAGNSLFISGESYAGVYVPTLALQILRNAPSIPLKGILVGNGVIGDAGQDDTRLAVEYLHGHGLYSDATYANIIKNCPDMRNPSPTCYAYLAQMESQVGHVNIYNIYGPCINHGFPPESNKATSATRYWKRPLSKGEQVLFGKGQVGGPDACIDAGAATYYLNLDVVRQALHAKPVSQIGRWQICTDRLIYNVIQPSLLPDYKNTLIPNIRVLIYNGEADACVPYNGNEEWTSGLGVPVQEDWRAWLVDQQVAGYVTTYQSNFKFATIKGAGHMVPQTQPQWAFYMFSRFINNQPL